MICLATQGLEVLGMPCLVSDKPLESEWFLTQCVKATLIKSRRGLEGIRKPPEGRCGVFRHG